MPLTAIQRAQQSMAKAAASMHQEAADRLERAPKPATPNWIRAQRLAIAEKHLRTAEKVEREWFGGRVG